MHNNRTIRRAGNALLLAAIGLTAAISSAFREPGEPEATYLHSIRSSGSQTTISYNADKSISRLTQVIKGESGEYQYIIIPVYENGRLVKTLSTDDANASTGDITTTLDYTSGGQVQRISYYRDNAAYAYDSLAYNGEGKIVTRYQFTKQPAKNAWENSGYQEYTWDENGNISRQDNYGKQPGYSKFLQFSSISYRYDNKVNPRSQQGLAFILDLQPAYLSAHNVVGETLVSSRASTPVTGTCVYTYTGGRFPLKATYTSDADREIVKMEFTRL